MTEEKFIHDSKTVLKFIKCYCDHKHYEDTQTKETLNLVYKDKDLKTKLEFELCPECRCTLFYSYEKLQGCPHDEKPSCRKCPRPCYDKHEWKKLAKIMTCSGMLLGLSKIKRFFKRDRKMK